MAAHLQKTAPSSPPLRFLGQCRVVMDAPADGAWNMALDEVLLNTAMETGLATLRFYQWQRPTLSLGYFQAHAELAKAQLAAECEIVRRCTGGGAILHDQDLTYSLCLPAASPWAKRATDLYRVVHELIQAWLTQAGIPVSLVPCPRGACNPTADHCSAESGQQHAALSSTQSAEPFLCFDRRGTGDVVSQARHPGAKLLGSAQRRKQGNVLQHGSLLLGRSTCVPHLPGLAECGAATQLLMDLPATQWLWAQSLLPQLELTATVAPITPLELQQAHALQREKYGHPNWLHRK